MNNLDYIIKIARQVRKVCLDFAMSEESIDYDFYKNKDLACMCAVASSFLQNILAEENIRVNLREMQGKYGGHCFNEIDGTVIDITATQFGARNHVVIKNLKDHEKWLKELGAKRSHIIKKVMWGMGQSPSRTLTKKLKKIYNRRYKINK